MKLPQLSRAGKSPTMCRTMGAARASGPSRARAAAAAQSCGRPPAGRGWPGHAPRHTDNQETR
ncbi:hypothetical protein FCJ57_14780 [Burkholderia diffusa]|nr:hypothetical protein [Burkholderia diffusa]